MDWIVTPWDKSTWSTFGDNYSSTKTLTDDGSMLFDNDGNAKKLAK